MSGEVKRCPCMRRNLRAGGGSLEGLLRLVIQAVSQLGMSSGSLPSHLFLLGHKVSESARQTLSELRQAFGIRVVDQGAMVPEIKRDMIDTLSVTD